ncbi:HvfC/BufC family peptide modification chaperone [Campylobacter sp.]|uniref:HvfC/BufC family peptide modification chaperone n=1 Tax=Campylobacter sp. TaxID=205 RepID=UPI0026FB2EA4|nr:putative DNA-binding domain-containing protein [Campylobacter sp.]
MSLNKSQSKFFKEITGQVKISSKGTRLYTELIFNRFYEVLANANPILFSVIGEDKFKEEVSEFIARGYAKTMLIWQLPKDFRKFIKEQKRLKEFAFVDDLLWLEFSEVELFMQDFSALKFDKFSWQNRYKISKNAKIKILNYKVHLKEFAKKEKSYLLAYYDLKTNQAVYREISNFMYDFLRNLKKFSASQLLENLQNEYEFDKKAMKKELEISLKELCSLRVLERI